MIGKVIKAISGFYYCENDEGIFECKAKGSFKHQNTIIFAGDNVEFQKNTNGYNLIYKILDRKNFLLRPPIANIDKVFIVSGFKTPEPSYYLIDKMCAIAEFHGIKPIIVLNKCDLGNFNEQKEVYASAGYPVYVVSAEKKIGINELKKETIGVTSAFIGNSGVGKSSIINCLFEGLNLKTGEVSEKLGRGRHTTRDITLIKHNLSGYIADTPGFSTLDFSADSLNIKSSLDCLFPDFKKYIESCEYNGCSHTNEKGCAVIEACSGGLISHSRYESYKLMYNELKDIKPWNFTK